MIEKQLILFFYISILNHFSQKLNATKSKSVIPEFFFKQFNQLPKLKLNKTIIDLDKFILTCINLFNSKTTKKLTS